MVRVEQLDKLKKLGFIGAFLAGLLCFSPVLVFVLGVFGLGLYASYAEFVLVPVLIISVGLIGFVMVWQNRKKADPMAVVIKSAAKRAKELTNN